MVKTTPKRSDRRTSSGAKYGARVNGSDGHHRQSNENKNETGVHELNEDGVTENQTSCSFGGHEKKYPVRIVGA